MSLISSNWKLKLHRRSYNTKRGGFGGGAGSGGSTTQSGPFAGQQPYLEQTFADAQGLYGSYTPQYYGYTNGTQTGGSSVAPLNSTESGALNQMANLGQNGTPALTDANNAIDSYSNGSMLSAQNPYFQNVANQTASSVTPQLMSSFTQGTNDNPNVALAASNGVANAVGNLAYNNYNTQTQNQLTAAQAAPYLYNTQMQGAQGALTAGQAQQTQSQNELNNSVNAYNYYQQLPYTQLNNYANLVNGQYGASTTNTAPGQSLFQEIFQGNMSDRRLKEDIKRIGTADNGLPLYIYRYKNDETCRVHIGFMADEVEKLHPDAVHERPDGFKEVDYVRASA